MEEKSVAAVERALSILDAFRPGDSAVSLAELSRRTGLYNSTIIRLAATLERSDYLIRTIDGRYRIGAKPFYLGSIFQQGTQAADLILPALEALALQTRESAGFYIRDGKQRICLYRVDSPHVVRDHVRVGTAMPLNRGAAGKAILAFTKPWEPAYEATRRALVAMSVEEITPEVASVAAPIFDANQDILGALVLSGPKTRFKGTALAEMRAALVDAARRLTKNLGGDATLFG